MPDQDTYTRAVEAAAEALVEDDGLYWSLLAADERAWWIARVRVAAGALLPVVLADIADKIRSEAGYTAAALNGSYARGIADALTVIRSFAASLSEPEATGEIQ